MYCSSTIRFRTKQVLLVKCDAEEMCWCVCAHLNYHTASIIPEGWPPLYEYIHLTPHSWAAQMKDASWRVACKVRGARACFYRVWWRQSIVWHARPMNTMGALFVRRGSVSLQMCAVSKSQINRRREGNLCARARDQRPIGRAGS